MSNEPLLPVHRVLPEGGPGTFSAEECRAILEVAYLASEADDVLAEEEIVAFKALAQRLAALGGVGGSMAAGDVVALRDELAQKADGTTRRDWLKTLAVALARPLAADNAYKVAMAMGMCDFASSDAEGDFEEELVSALGFTEQRADDLAAEVYAVIGEDEDDLDDEELDDDDELDEDEDEGASEDA